MDPQAASQPSQQTGVEQSRNPADQTSAERNVANGDTSQNAPTMETRTVPSQRSEEHSNPTPASMGYGEQGPLKERNISESDEQNYSNDGNLDGEQMRAPGEGEVADAVQGKGKNARTGHGEEESLVDNLGAKSDAHEDELHRRGQRTGKEIEEEEGEDWTGMRGKVDLNEALGRDRNDGEVTGVGETERGTGVVLAAETVSGTKNIDANESLTSA